VLKNTFQIKPSLEHRAMADKVLTKKEKLEVRFVFENTIILLKSI